MNDGQENRRSFRVSESVFLKYETLTEDEFREGLEHRKIRLGQSDSAHAMLVDLDARLSEEMFRLGGEYERVGKCITLLNDKINVVMDQLPGLRKTKSALASSTPLTCDVGADGIVFPSDRLLQVDSKIYVQLLLTTDNRYFDAFARVVRHTDAPAGNSPDLNHGIAIEFLGMKPAQREILIQHMFNRESETLRMRRLQTEDEFD